MLLLWLLVMACTIFFGDGALQLQGAGSTLAYPVYTAASLAYSFVEANVSVNYAGLGSGAGICRIENATRMCAANAMGQPLYLDFAGSDALLGTSDYAQFPDLQMYPTMAAAVVPIFNLGSITNVTFSTSLLAQIFRAKVQYWDDPAILSLNPHLNGSIPSRQPIALVVRSDSSGTTQIFKKALAAFDSVFQSQIGTSSSNVWTNVTATKRSGNQGVVSYVMSTAYTFGYSELGIVLTNNLPMVKLQKTDGSIVSASITSTDYAVLELGLSFGNNGDDPSHLTADLQNAQGANAWPIVGYTYLVMRKNSLRPGASCFNVKATVNFWYWFWTSSIASRIVGEQHFSALPAVVQQAVLSRFVSDIMCDSQAMYESKVLVAVNGQGTQLLGGLFTTLIDVYSLVDSSANLTYTTEVSAGYVEDDDLTQSMFVASTNSALSAPTNGYKLVFAGAGLAVISLMNVTLDGATLAGILQGDITTWLDPALAALNPWGITDSSGALVTNKSLPIQLLRGPIASGSSLTSLMTGFLPAYTGSALLAAPLSVSDNILRYRVLGTPLALAVTPYTGDFPSGIQLASYRHSDGTLVPPSWQAIRACATNATYNAAENAFQLAASTSPTCYPLALSVHLRVRKSQCSSTTDASRTATVSFIEWMFSNGALANALEAAYLAPLTDANTLANVTNQAVLDAISCVPKVTTSDSSFPFFIIIIMCVAGGVLFLIIPALLWHSTRRMRALRKQFSNDNVAQECAAAIARFDLDAVVWLNDLKNPNKIQKSFMQIVRLLTEVKPFIPDQLLQQLTGQEEDAPCDDDGEKEEVGLGSDVESPAGKSLQGSPPASNHPAHPAYAAHSAMNGSGDSVVASPKPVGRAAIPLIPSRSPTTTGQVAGPPHSPGNRSVRQRPKCESVFSIAPEVEQKWTRKRGAMLYAKLGSRGNMDDPTTLHELSCVVTSFIPIAKRHGATIERVGVETMIVHWGLAGYVAQSAEKATLAAMEMVALMQSKFGCLRLSLKISVTYGWCHVTTLSASGHRFFISAGSEMNLATHLVHNTLYEKCRTALLVSPNVYNEVHYNIKCLPRAWFGDMLLWQPMEHVKHEECDEWMYELQRVESGEEAALKYIALVEVFAMVAHGASPSAIQQAVKLVEEQHSQTLTAEDLASLDNLVASLHQLISIPPRLSIASIDG